MKNNGFLIMGFVFIAFGFFLFGPTLFLSESALIEKEGLVENVEVQYSIVHGRSGWSFKSSLVFNFKKDSKTYIVSRNIGKSSFDDKYENIKRELRKIRRAKVTIKKSDDKNNSPKVFGISKDTGEILYTLKEAKEVSRTLFIGTLILGFFFIIKSFVEEYFTFRVSPNFQKIINTVKLILLRMIGPGLAISFGTLFILFVTSDEPFNPVSLIFGVFTFVFIYGTIKFEQSIRNNTNTYFKNN